MEAVQLEPYVRFKEAQKHGWAHFAPLEANTTPAAARLVTHARIVPGARVLDVACGTGVVAITAALRGAQATGLDLTPALLERARENAAMAGVSVEFDDGDVEQLPYADASFDVLLSQFGHIFAPRPDVAIAEMLRVLKPGGTIAFSTWPPELFVGRMFALTGRYMPPPPIPAAPPALWGDPNVIRERLGDRVRDLVFDRERMLVPALSVPQSRTMLEQTAGPLIKLVEMLSRSDSRRLEEFRRECDALIGEYFADNQVRQDYLLTRALKK